MKDAKKKAYRPPLWFWIAVVVLVTIIAVTAGPAMHGHITTPGIADFFPEAIFGEGTWYQFNRMALARVIVGGVVVLIFVLGTRRLRMIPRRGQQLLEMTAEFLRNNIAIGILGEKNGRKYAPLIGMLFVSVFAMNITGVVPGIDIAASSVMAVPLVFAVIAYVSYISAGIKERGFLRFFREQLFMPGVPWVIYFLLTPIEFFSNFIVRPVTLAIRLLCNMISGHLLLAMTYFGTSTILLTMQGAGRSLALLTGVAAFAVTLFEIFVAFLQAYIFSVLTSVYIKLSVEAH